MRRLTLAVVLLALLPFAASAQQHPPVTKRSDADKRRDAEIEKDYKETMKRMDAGKSNTPVDPWAAVRTAPAAGDTTKK
jgi:hypothetical protein